jgi:4-hydroxy-3-polyprenylbenzoate decarboxylase
LDSDQTSNNASPARTKPQISLLDLPILKCWPKDGGRFITFPNVHTRDPESGARNVGMYRMQFSMSAHRDALAGAQSRRSSRQSLLSTGRAHAGRVTLGGDPALTFAATAPLPDGLDEILFAGFLRKKSVELVKCKTIDVEVPADADFVLEGFVQPAKCDRRDRSATTPVSTPRSRIILSFI